MKSRSHDARISRQAPAATLTRTVDSLYWQKKMGPQLGAPYWQIVEANADYKQRRNPNVFLEQNDAEDKRIGAIRTRNVGDR